MAGPDAPEKDTEDQKEGEPEKKALPPRIVPPQAATSISTSYGAASPAVSPINQRFEDFEAVLDDVQKFVGELIKTIAPVLGPDGGSKDVSSARSDDAQSDIAARIAVNTDHLAELRDRILQTIERVEL
jgi:hypothetical protein